jgi:hypothetical protein
MPIIFHPDADAEVNEAVRYYEARESGQGSDLLREVERVLDLISANPEASRRMGGRVGASSCVPSVRLPIWW